jgi:hypothetical protein
VNQQLADGGWDASETFRFTTNACGVVSAPPSRRPAEASFEVEGFTDRVGTGLLPSNFAPAGGVLRTCNPQMLYVIVSIEDLPAARDVNIAWYFNGSQASVPHSPFHLPAGSSRPVFSIGGVGNVLGVSDGTRVSFRMSSGGDIVEAEASVTIRCAG